MRIKHATLYLLIGSIEAVNIFPIFLVIFGQEILKGFTTYSINTPLVLKRCHRNLTENFLSRLMCMHVEIYI